MRDFVWLNSRAKFFSDIPFNFFRNLGDVLFSHSWIKFVLWLTVPCIFWCFFWKLTQTVNDVEFQHKTKGLQFIIVIMVPSFLLFIPFPWLETYSFTRKFKVPIEKSTLIILSTREKCRLLREINTSPSISFFIDRIFSILREKNVAV